jgi:hypothetical protein
LAPVLTLTDEAAVRAPVESTLYEITVPADSVGFGLVLPFATYKRSVVESKANPVGKYWEANGEPGKGVRAPFGLTR